MAQAAVCPLPASTAALGLLPESLSMLSTALQDLTQSLELYEAGPKAKRVQGHTADTLASSGAETVVGRQ